MLFFFFSVGFKKLFFFTDYAHLYWLKICQNTEKKSTTRLENRTLSWSPRRKFLFKYSFIEFGRDFVPGGVFSFQVSALVTVNAPGKKTIASP